MNKKVLSGRRMIKPAASLPAVLPGWQLTFSQLGLPYTEPGFAAVERQPAAATAEAANGGAAPPPSARQRRPDVHGVLHRITPSQWAYVLETEGASKEDSEDGGYAVVTTTAVTYDGKQVEGVKTLTVPARIKQRLQVSRASCGGWQRACGLRDLDAVKQTACVLALPALTTRCTRRPPLGPRTCMARSACRFTALCITHAHVPGCRARSRCHLCGTSPSSGREQQTMGWTQSTRPGCRGCGTTRRRQRGSR